MKSLVNSSPTICALVVILATVIHFPVLRCQETQPYDVCHQSVQCGDIEFKYPFWGLGRPEYCGHPGFQLTCQFNVTVLVLESVDYRVLDIDSSTQTITLARKDLWSIICPEYLHNTTYNSTLYNGDNFDQENASLYNRCQDNIPGLANYQFSCNVNGTQSDGYAYRTSLITPTVNNLLVQCNSYITIPVDRYFAIQLASGNASESDMRSALMTGFKLEWMANNYECDQCSRSNGRCGSNSTSPALFACYKRGEGISCSFIGIMSLLSIILCRKLRLHVTPKGPESANHQIEIFIRNHGCLAPKRYTYSEIKNMTNSFLDKVGQGGYGSVYKGQLPDGQLVAVKLLSEATGNGEDFINEVASISNTSHVNIVTLLGFCFERNKRALLYEFMPNGSLDKFLRGDGFHLDWNVLFKIAKDIARGLEYLHRGCNTRIVHFDIKPHNILLDEEFVPKISDFGLAKLCKKRESIVSVMGARGTAGYMAPEVFFRSLGGASHKSDVYSYGMMVLEMTGARKHNNTCSRSTSEAYFPDWIYKQVEVGGDLRDYGVTTKEEEELARRMMMVSLWCIQSNPTDRPSISKVVEMLEGSFESLQVPPRHFETSPTMAFQGTPHSSTQSSSGERVSTVQAKISLPNSHESS
ncbi:hypothetical protein SSX86_025287 [Deinandra increscens subsp. villosa]|uniref:non-specific serine/threonine protein kinase n=1 Tax=Deinandra increscens subsp. villosa TaxID=3103831 RepID=A0AAP0GN26_9ASTR